jgi:Zn finger protein HypA/HybF involved in hydrogenase expression
MYLDLALPEAGMSNVAIETKDVPATFLCSCTEQYTSDKFTAACPRCGGYQRTIVSGQDCMVESIEVDDD